MAIYVTSDLHGLGLQEFKKLLKQVNFGENDWLYILGDVIDRQGDGGIEILLWLLEQPNAQLILGNHEAMLLSCSFIFNEITEQSISDFNREKLELLTNYAKNGGDVTLKNLRELLARSPETIGDILDYLRDAPLCETVSVGDRDFLLVHSGIDNFEKSKKIDDYTAEDFLWAWPELEDRYFDDITVIFGHTPTMNYDKNMTGKILKTDTWIDIDVGVPYGNAPALLRLDDLAEFYGDTH